MQKPLMILTSDWHIWGTAPLFRSEEPDWLKAIERYLRQLKRFQKKNGNIPVIIAGDIFDYYNPPPYVINWLMNKMPSNVFAIPGQHDLQNHNIDLIEKTAFWTLVQADKISYLNPIEPQIIDCQGVQINIFSKPWKVEIDKPAASENFQIYVAHQYIYDNASNAYFGADSKSCIDEQKDFLENIDVAVFGDNHIPFNYALKNGKKTKVVNCGTLIRRKVDERAIQCGFYVLYDDLTIKRELFDLTDDKYAVIENSNRKIESNKTAELLKELQELDTVSFDYRDEVRRYMKGNKQHKELEFVEKIFENYKKS